MYRGVAPPLPSQHGVLDPRMNGSLLESVPSELRSVGYQLLIRLQAGGGR